MQKAPFSPQPPEMDEALEPTEENRLRQRITFLESDLQIAHNENRRIRVQLFRAQLILRWGGR